MIDLVDSIIRYEDGDLDDEGTLELFSYLVRTGSAWTLQGSYGRAAAAMIEEGWLDRAGTITREV